MQFEIDNIATGKEPDKFQTKKTQNCTGFQGLLQILENYVARRRFCGDSSQAIEYRIAVLWLAYCAAVMGRAAKNLLPGLL